MGGIFWTPLLNGPPYWELEYLEANHASTIIFSPPFGQTSKLISAELWRIYRWLVGTDSCINFGSADWSNGSISDLFNTPDQLHAHLHATIGYFNSNKAWHIPFDLQVLIPNLLSRISNIYIPIDNVKDNLCGSILLMVLLHTKVLTILLTHLHPRNPRPILFGTYSLVFPNPLWFGVSFTTKYLQMITLLRWVVAFPPHAIYAKHIQNHILISFSKVLLLPEFGFDFKIWSTMGLI